MALGTVKWYSDDKGYGFIALQDGSDVFVHFSNIQGDGYQTLEEGQGVELEVTEGSKGPMAANVREPGTPINTDIRPPLCISSTIVKVFQEDSIRRLEHEINEYIRDVDWRIISASMTNPDENGKVSAIVVFDRQ